MITSSNKILLLSVLLLSSVNVYAAETCKSFLTTHTSSIAGLLAPLEIQSLVKKIDFKSLSDPQSLSPSLNLKVYDRSESAILNRFKISKSEIGPRDRIVVTDYGYAILDIEELRDWTLLQNAIADQKRAKKFIDWVANTPGTFPNGITKEAAEWLRWSVFAQIESLRKAYKRIESSGVFEAGPFGFDMSLFQFKRTEYYRLVRQKELFMFPFGIDIRYEINEMADYDAPVVLEILARHFLISRLFVERPDGSYKQLSEFLDRDSLIFLSRFPELLASYPVFEGGHFSVHHMFTTVGRDDSYSIAERSLPRSSFYEDINYDLDFIANVSEEDVSSEEPTLDMYAFFRISFDEEIAEELSEEQVQRIYSAEIENMDNFLALKSRQFEEITGYRIPVSSAVEYDGFDDLDREFRVSFTRNDTPPHILAAFYVFAGIH